MLRWVGNPNELGKLYKQFKLMLFSPYYQPAHLLLVTSLQFASWVDAVILVFSLENEASFQEVYKIYHQLAACRPVSEIPFIVVGTQGEPHTTCACDLKFLQQWSFVAFVICPFFLDKISSTNPRVIDDARARQLCSDVRRCTYYETCATYGLNVNRVFTDGMRPFKVRPENFPAEDAEM